MTSKVQGCIDKVRSKLREGTTVSKEQVQQMLMDVQNQLSRGRTPDDILAEIESITKARKEKIKRMGLLNKMSDFVKRKDHVNQILELARNDSPVKLFGKTIYDPMEHAFTTIALNHEQHLHTLRNHYWAKLDGRLADADLVEYAQNKNNQANIIKELRAQQVELGGEKPVKSVTKDEKAFQTARILNQSFEESLSRKTAAGSITGYLPNRITAQMWSSAKFADLSDKQFLELFRGQKYNGEFIPDSEWLRFKEEVIANHFVDIEENFEPMKIFNNARKIELDEEFYIQNADRLMEGNSLVERVFLELGRDARATSNLEFFGSNPRQQYDDILNQVIANTRGSKDATRGGKNVLDNDFYKKKLRSAMFGDMNRVDSRLLSDVASIARGGSAFAKLGSGIITSQLDWLTEAITRLLLKDGKSNMFSELGEAFGNFKKLSGKDKHIYNAELRSFNVVVNTMYESLNESLRFADMEMAPGQTRLSKVKEVITKGNKINFIQQFTDVKQKASYLGSANIAHSYADLDFDSLPDYFNRTLRESNISREEWEFLRQNGKRTFRGQEGYIDAVALEDLELGVFGQLAPGAKSDFALNNIKNKMIAKWQVHLYKQAKQMTLIPSNVDRARLYQGTQAGTAWGEIARTTTQFKQFSFAFATRFLFPLIKNGNAATITQFMGASMAMGMLVTWTRDMVHNKTPRDFTKGENWLPIVAQTFGFPFFDTATAMLTGQSRPSVAIGDLIAGPIFSDALETAERGYGLATKAIKGEADTDDFLAAIGKTMGPALPFRSYPIAGPLFDGLLYDSFMESVDPGYIDAKEERLEERGQSQDFVQGVIGAIS